MASEADSKHTLPSSRWGETASEVPDANVVEPSGGKKDVGWLPGGEGLVGEWLNWCSWAAFVGLRYFHNVFELMHQHNFVMPGNSGGAVTAGVGLSVNVTAARCWLTTNGGLYQVLGATNLALGAADAVNPRIDRVVARVVAGVPTFVVIAGTPGASPSAPAITAGDARIAQVRVNALAVVPTTITDERDFGIVDVGTVEAQDHLYGGELAGGDWMFEVDGASQLIVLGDSSAPLMQIAPLQGGIFVDCVTFTIEVANKVDITGNIEVDGVATFVNELVVTGVATVEPDEGFLLSSAITAFKDFDPYRFIVEVISGSAPGTAGSNGVWYRTVNAGAVIEQWIGVEVPHGATITAVRVRGTKASTDAYVEIFLSGVSRTVNTNVWTETDDNDGSAIGDFVLEITGLAHVVNQATRVYRLWMYVEGGTSGLQFWGAEIEYTITQPFDGA